MCGRFTLRTEASRLAEAFGGEPADYAAPRYNVVPGSPVLALRAAGSGGGPGGGPGRALVRLRWGLVPAWAQDAAIGPRLINARAESVAEKPAFRAAFRARRCLVLADGFYEWRREGAHRQPFFVRLEPDRPFAFAGLWERWTKGAAPIESCTIVTTEANAALQAIHPRMPAIVAPEDYDLWLAAAPDFAEAARMLLKAYAGAMAVYPVSARVNDAHAEGAALIAPKAPEEEAEEEAPEPQGRLF